eukprot:Em0013g1048a
MQVFVRLETGRIIAIEVSPMDTIDNIKMKIRDKEGLSPESFILQHGDMEVEEGRTLNDYDIRNETTLYLKKNVLRPFTESLHTTSRSGKEVDTMELLAIRHVRTPGECGHHSPIPIGARLCLLRSVRDPGPPRRGYRHPGKGHEG